MDNISDQLTDEQLQAIMDETGPWAVGGQGSVLGLAESLRHAIHRRAEYAGWGATVTALHRLPPGAKIVILPAQIARLQRNADSRSDAVM